MRAIQNSQRRPRTVRGLRSGLGDGTQRRAGAPGLAGQSLTGVFGALEATGKCPRTAGNTAYNVANAVELDSRVGSRLTMTPRRQLAIGHRGQ